MRIIAGKFKGRRLKSLAGKKVRPSGDRLKESLFNILGSRLPHSHFLDLFAGTGAIGMEALSRGASSVVFVEKDRDALHCLRQNLESCQVQHGFQILGLEMDLALKRLSDTGAEFDLIFLDPPYLADLYHASLNILGQGRLLSNGGWVVAQHPRRLSLRGEYGSLRQLRNRMIGRSGLTFFE